VKHNQNLRHAKMEKIAYKKSQELLSGQLTSFDYLHLANDYLSNPVSEKVGRELVIRALALKDSFVSNQGLLKNLVRKSGLYPYLQNHFEKRTDEQQLVLDLYRSKFDSDFVFHAMQAKILNLLMGGENVVLSAPTSMGKSIIIDSLISSSKYNRMVIVVPTIALIDETRRRITKKFNDDYQIIFHGSQVVTKKKAIFILTQERVNERDDIKNIDMFIIDEFYKLAYKGDNDDSRVISLNIALSKLLSVSKQFYMIGPNIDSVRGLDSLNKRYIFIPSEFNTVALNVSEYDIGANDSIKKNDALYDILNVNQGQCIVYCQSPSSTAKVAEYIRKNVNVESDIDADYIEWVSINYGSDWGYTKALTNGIGIHHGILPRAIQQKTIDLFNEHKIRILLCTSTIIEGVNTVAENVVIYDNRAANRSIDKFTHNNIAGRSGRMNEHLIGNVFCLEKIPENTIESKVVDIPLGLQTDDTSMNLLAGIQHEHISDKASEEFSRFLNEFRLPIELLKNNSTYNTETLLAALNFVEDCELSQVYTLLKQQKPDKTMLQLMVDFIKLVEARPLQRLNLHFEDNATLKHRFSNYIFANSHQDYIDARLKDIYISTSDSVQRAEKTEKELTILRNIFKYAIPRALNLLQDIVNYVYFDNDNPEATKVDFGYLMHIFENSHLSASFTALEEMGVSIQTLEKLYTERLGSARIEVLVRYLRLNSRNIKQFDDIDRMFIQRALG